ncbi:hypothetical protein KKC88_05750 [Patescibacteria group bacterium]|nr:hypothetical protein [Patescibacteria group bacterium]MBU1673626.1 hypothetical protein [Patescibacteria group bacterium]MBU1963886.1 hypothetical protein [Patescibacteria group bacterium]
MEELRRVVDEAAEAGDPHFGSDQLREIAARSDDPEVITKAGIFAKLFEGAAQELDTCQVLEYDLKEVVQIVRRTGKVPTLAIFPSIPRLFSDTGAISLGD